MKMQIRWLSVSLVGLVLLGGATPSSVASQVLVVDQNNGPGTDHVSLQLAVASSGDGDILLVRPGIYGASSIDGKSLTVIGDPGPAGELPTVQHLTIRNIGSTRSVVVRGLIGQSDPFGGAKSIPASLWIEKCAGPVLIEDFSVALDSSIYAQPLGVLIRNSPRVVLTRCSARGAPSTHVLSPAEDVPTPGLRIVDSDVYLYECRVAGGAGNDATVLPPSIDFDSVAGATGIELESGKLVAVGCTIRGGAGGDGLKAGAICKPSSDGGIGLVVGGDVTRVDCTIRGGAAGVDPPGCPQVGVGGQNIVPVSGVLTLVPDTLRSYAVDSPVRVGRPATTTLVGVPGEFAGLLLSLTPGVLDAPTFKGGLVPGPPLLFVGLGLIPASGVLTFVTPVPAAALPAGFDGLELFQQVLVAGQDGFGLLGSPTTLVLLDSSF